MAPTPESRHGSSGGHGEAELAHGPRNERSPAGLTRLRWLAILVPLAFVAALNYLLHTALSGLHDFPGVLVVFALVAGGIAAFSFAVFGVVSRLERRIVERNAMLAALLEVGREASSSLDLHELVDKSLDAILDVTSAEAAEVWLMDGDDGLVLANHRGLAPEAFRERVRFRLGEGLPGIAAERGAPIAVRDLPADDRFLRAAVRRLGFQSFSALPLRHRGETHGVLCVAIRERDATYSEVERGLLEGVGERLAVAIENSRLHERVLDEAVLAERERIARELHDGLAQILGYINAQTLAVKKLLASGRTDDALTQLEAMEKAAKGVYADVREGIYSLRTPVSSADGMPAAVRAHLRNYREMPGAPGELEVREEGELPALAPAIEFQLIRIVQEALNNVRKHAGSDRATIGFSIDAGELVVSVEDDGRGFEPEQRMPTGWPHFGLQTLRERAEAIGGRFEIESELGLGSTVRVYLPQLDRNGARA